MQNRVITDINVLCFFAATAYGKGVYFASSFSFSTKEIYSPPDINNNKYIFQCRVLTGHHHVGNPQFVEPPVRDKKTLALYNSVVDCVKSPSIFVVFRDTQAYPEYLVVFRLWYYPAVPDCNCETSVGAGPDHGDCVNTYAS